MSGERQLGWTTDTPAAYERPEVPRCYRSLFGIMIHGPGCVCGTRVYKPENVCVGTGGGAA